MEGRRVVQLHIHQVKPSDVLVIDHAHYSLESWYRATELQDGFGAGAKSLKATNSVTVCLQKLDSDLQPADIKPIHVIAKVNDMFSALVKVENEEG